jgi:hypothetical protein
VLPFEGGIDEEDLAHVFRGENSGKMLITGALKDGQGGAGAGLKLFHGAREGGIGLEVGRAVADELPGGVCGSVCGETGDKIRAEEHADEIAFAVENGKVMLRPGEKGIDGILKSGVFAEGAKIGNHGVADAEMTGGLADLDGLAFLGGGKIDKDGDEDEDGLHTHEGEEAADEGDGLADMGSDIGGAGVVHAAGEEGAQDASAVHGEGGDHIEEDEEDVDAGEIGKNGRGIVEVGEVFGGGQAAEDEEEDCGDDDVDEGARHGDDEFLRWFLRHALEASESTDGEEGDVGGANAESPSGEGMAEFMEEHAKEESADKDQSGDGLGHAAFREECEAEEGEQKEKGEMNANVGAGDASDAEGPFHGGNLRWMVRGSSSSVLLHPDAALLRALVVRPGGRERFGIGDGRRGFGIRMTQRGRGEMTGCDRVLGEQG